MYIVDKILQVISKTPFESGRKNILDKIGMNSKCLQKRKSYGKVDNDKSCKLLQNSL